MSARGRPSSGTYARLLSAASAWRRRVLHGVDPQILGPAVLEGLGLAGRGPAADAFLVAASTSPRRLPGALGGLLHDPGVLAELTPPMLARQWLGPRPWPRFISLGTQCYTSALLQRFGLRDSAGPFDWLFSNMPMITHALNDDFRIFLDRSLYRPVPVEARKAGPTANRAQHEYYRQQFGVEYVFNHHDAHLDEVHAGFVRRVHRLLDLLAANEPKLLLCTCWHSQHYVHEVETLHAALSRLARRFRLVVVGIDVAKDALLPRLTELARGPGWRTLHYESLSHWEPLAFPNPLDDMNLMYALAQEVRSLD